MQPHRTVLGGRGAARPDRAVSGGVAPARDGAEDVEFDARLTLRFSTPLALDPNKDDSSIVETFQLSSGDLPVALAVIPAENGRLVFLTPELPLEPETTYRLSIAGAVGRDRRAAGAGNNHLPDEGGRATAGLR